MVDYYSILFLISITLVLSSALSSLINSKAPVSIPLLATAAGILAGPLVFNLINPAGWYNFYAVIGETARFTLAISLMAVALRIKPEFITVNLKSIFVILLMVMPLMFLMSSVITYLFFDLTIAAAFIVGACVTPTDPVVASSIVSGKIAKKLLPEDLRHTISAESGANDGLALSLVMLPVLLYQHSFSVAIGEWFFKTILLEVILGFSAGAVIGLAAGYLQQKAEEHKLIEEIHTLSYTAGIALVTLSASELMNLNGIFAVFIAGVFYSRVINRQERGGEEKVEESLDKLFTLPIFILFGASLPWTDWLNLDFIHLLAAAVLILIFRRLPFIIMFNKKIKPLNTNEDIYFAGWFGPIGVAAYFI